MASGTVNYCEVFIDTNKGPFDIFVDGKLKYPTLTRTQADFYWQGLNIFNGHTATLKKNGKVLDRKS